MDIARFCLTLLFCKKVLNNVPGKVRLVYSLKVEVPPSKKNYVICFNEKPLKITKNAFYLTLKALVVLKIFKFLSRIFGHVEKMARLER